MSPRQGKVVIVCVLIIAACIIFTLATQAYFLGYRQGLRYVPPTSGVVLPANTPLLVYHDADGNVTGAVPRDDRPCYAIKGITMYQSCPTKWESEHCTAEGIKQQAGMNEMVCGPGIDPDRPCESQFGCKQHEDSR